jgi:hypothetical protein
MLVEILGPIIDIEKDEKLEFLSQYAPHGVLLETYLETLEVMKEAMKEKEQEYYKPVASNP